MSATSISELDQSSLEYTSLESENDNGQIVMTGYSQYGTPTSTTQPEIVLTIRQFQIEIEVVNKAVEIYYEINNRAIESKGPSEKVYKIKSVKGSRKLRLIFYCIFMAYSRLDYPVDPCYAADIVKLPHNEIETAFNEYTTPGVTLIEPEKMVRFYMNRINQLIANTGIQYDVNTAVEGVCNIIKVCRSNALGQEWIINNAAKIVAIGAVYFYLNDIKRLDVSQCTSIFEQACYLSWACIRRYHEQISKYYNLTTKDAKVVRTEIKLPFYN